jgi:hypothetical protein
MKKFIILILCLITSLCITGCKESEKEEDNYFTLNDVILRKERFSSCADAAVPMSAINVYHISINDYFDLFECNKMVKVKSLLDMLIKKH